MVVQRHVYYPRQPAGNRSNLSVWFQWVKPAILVCTVISLMYSGNVFVMSLYRFFHIRLHVLTQPISVLCLLAIAGKVIALSV